MKLFIVLFLIGILFISPCFAVVGKYQFVVLREGYGFACDTETGKIYGFSAKQIGLATTEAERKEHLRWEIILPAIK